MARTPKSKVTSAEAASKRATKKAVAAQKTKPAKGKAKPFKVDQKASDLAGTSGMTSEQFKTRVSTPDKLGNTANTPESQRAVAAKIASEAHKARMPGRGSRSTENMKKWALSNPNRETNAGRSERGARFMNTQVEGHPGEMSDIRKWQAARPAGGSRNDYINWAIRKPGFQRESARRAKGLNPYGDDKGQQFKGKDGE